MNELSLMQAFVIAQFQSNNLVNTISTVDTDEMDANKENIYALVNLDLRGTDIQDDVISVQYIITIVQMRDIRPQKTDSKLLEDSNYIDNLNETHSIAQRFINYLARQNNDDNIEIENLSTVTILKDWRHGLDGVQFTIDLVIPNLGTSC